MADEGSPAKQPSIVVALACLKTGMLLEVFGDQAGQDLTEDLAAAAPDFFGTAEALDWAGVFRALSENGEPRSQDIVLLSEDCVRVVQRLVHRPGTAIVAVGAGTRNIGLVLAAARSKALELERR